MNLLKRIISLIRGLLTQRLSRLEDRPENIEAQLSLSVFEISRQYETTQQAVTAAMCR